MLIITVIGNYLKRCENNVYKYGKAITSHFVHSEYTVCFINSQNNQVNVCRNDSLQERKRKEGNPLWLTVDDLAR